MLAVNWKNENNTLMIAESNVVYSKNYSGEIGFYYEHSSAVFFIKDGVEGFAEEIAKQLNYLSTFCEK